MAPRAEDYNGSDLVAVAITFLALTYVFIFVRIFVRLRIMRAFWADDWFLLMAQVNQSTESVELQVLINSLTFTQISFTLLCSFILRSVHWGLGRHNDILPKARETQAIKVHHSSLLWQLHLLTQEPVPSTGRPDLHHIDDVYQD